MFFSASATFFYLPVLIISKCGCDEKMLWIYTKWGVAFMSNHLKRRDQWFDREMCHKTVRSVGIILKRYLSIPIVSNWARVNPASFFIDFVPHVILHKCRKYIVSWALL